MANPIKWMIAAAALIASAARALGPSPSLMNAPIAEMDAIAPSQYREASALAEREADPLRIALKIAGALSGSTQHIVQRNDARELPLTSPPAPQGIDAQGL